MLRRVKISRINGLQCYSFLCVISICKAYVNLQHNISEPPNRAELCFNNFAFSIGFVYNYYPSYLSNSIMHIHFIILKCVHFAWNSWLGLSGIIFLQLYLLFLLIIKLISCSKTMKKLYKKTENVVFIVWCHSFVVLSYLSKCSSKKHNRCQFSRGFF